MSRYNQYMNSHFAGCKLLAEAHDPHRNRNVNIYMMPGTNEVVGVTDGVDSWMAPAQAHCFSVNIPDLLRKIAVGEFLGPVRRPAPATAKRERRVLSDAQEPPRRERRVIVEAEAVRRPSTHRTLIG